jgi:membrane associated rhomboid family serine protease
MLGINTMSHVPDWLTAARVLAVCGLALGVAVAVRTLRWLDGEAWLSRGLGGWAGASAATDDTDRRLLALARRRLVWGVPWGTLVFVAVLLGVYLIVQRGATSWTDPLTIPFRSWSYRHPVGVILSPFAHSGPGHLLNNLLGVLVFGTLAEVAVGHARPTSDADGWRGDPRVRAGFVLPAAAIVLGILVSIASWGPTIGASGVVFALVGIAVVHFPLTTALALLARGTIETVGRAVTDPVVVATGTVGGGRPWWADVAIQTHAFGFLAGVLVGALVLRWRDEGRQPAATRTWVGMLLAGVSLSLWAVWWTGPDGLVLLRGLGVPLLLALATLVVVGTRAVATGLPGIDRQRSSRLGLALLAGPLVVMLVVAVPLGVLPDVSTPTTNESVTVGDYTVTYVEGVPDQRLDALTAITGGDPVRTSGVVVTDPERGIWTRAISRRELARDGTARVSVGGIRWDRTVFVVRRGWRTAGGGHVYAVWLNPADGPFPRVFTSRPAGARPVVAGRSLTIRPAGRSFELVVRRNGTQVGSAPVPGYGENVTVGGLRVDRRDGRLVAITNDTRVTVAWGG